MKARDGYNRLISLRKHALFSQFKSQRVTVREKKERCTHWRPKEIFSDEKKGRRMRNAIWGPVQLEITSSNYRLNSDADRHEIADEPRREK